MNLNIDKETVNDLYKNVDIQTLVANHAKTILAPGIDVEVTMNEDGSATVSIAADKYKPEPASTKQSQGATKPKAEKVAKEEAVAPKADEPKPTLKNNPLFKDSSEDDEVVTTEKPKGFSFGGMKSLKND